MRSQKIKIETKIKKTSKNEHELFRFRLIKNLKNSILLYKIFVYSKLFSTFSNSIKNNQNFQNTFCKIAKHDLKKIEIDLHFFVFISQFQKFRKIIFNQNRHE